MSSVGNKAVTLVEQVSPFTNEMGGWGYGLYVYLPLLVVTLVTFLSYKKLQNNQSMGLVSLLLVFCMLLSNAAWHNVKAIYRSDWLLVKESGLASMLGAIIGFTVAKGLEKKTFSASTETKFY